MTAAAPIATEDLEQLGTKTPVALHGSETSLRQILEELQVGRESVKIHLHRKFPQTWKGPDGKEHNIAGKLETFNEPVDEDQIKELHGGGAYTISIQVVGKSGKWEFLRGGHRTFRIAGDPKMRGIFESGHPPAPAADAATRQAMTTMERLLEKNQSDPSMKMLVESLQRQLETMQNTVAAKDEKILEFMTKPTEAGTTDRLLEKMLDNEGARIMSLRAQHESELGTVRERHLSDVDRIHAQYERAAQMANDTHLREIASLTRSYEGRIESLNLAHSSAIHGWQRELANLDRLYTASQAEITQLRSEKQKSPMDMLKEIGTIREALEGFAPEPAAPSSAFEKMAEVFAPVAAGIAQRIAEGPGGAPAGPEAAAAPAAAGRARPQEDLPVGRPRRTPDGRVVVRMPDGTIAEVRPKKKPTVEVKGGETVEVSPAEIRAAVKFMEGAVGTDPRAMAATVRALLPLSIQKAFAADARGVDHFLEEVASLEPGSVLATTSGRDWIREVAKHVFQVS